VIDLLTAPVPTWSFLVTVGLLLLGLLLHSHGVRWR
jgi:hypothetical protein